jgi:hypothetical protein
LVSLLFGCFELPQTKGIVPAPDGGYPGGNTAEGQNALLSLTTGGFNTAFGLLSLRSDTTGSCFNVTIGAVIVVQIKVFEPYDLMKFKPFWQESRCIFEFHAGR